jgi:hypothetical protein
MSSFSSDGLYFREEGKGNLHECLVASMESVVRFGLSKLVIFTAKGDGLDAALRLKEVRPEFDQIQLVGVTFPQGKVFPGREGVHLSTRFEPQLLEELANARVPLVRARLPFDPIWRNYPTSSTVAQELSSFGGVLNIFGGGMSLCVQASLMACDAGYVDWGEHIVVMSADTSVLLQAAPTDHFMTDLIVREIVCKPIFLTVTRKEEAPEPADGQTDMPDQSEASGDDIALLGS